MPWNTQTLFARRLEFVQLALAGGIDLSALCARFGISRKIGYKWLARYKAQGEAGLRDQPRGRARRANQTPEETEKRILTLRGEHPSWGARKLKRRLLDLDATLTGLPAHSTFGRVLKRHGCIDPSATAAHTPVQRFERAAPNQLWQMDFKGHFALQRGGRCHPLTVLDDCSRYLLGLQACADEQHSTVQGQLEQILRLHGLPECILCDNGAPWSGCGPEPAALAVWLLRLGVRVIHGRPYHPQTQGKDERFHRTLKADLLARHDWLDLAQAGQRFEEYRRLYNHDRPHEALGLATPASRYQASARTMPATLL